jgi:uncharacterized protein YybS (DUF2232 family)
VIERTDEQLDKMSVSEIMNEAFRSTYEEAYDAGFKDASKAMSETLLGTFKQFPGTETICSVISEVYTTMSKCKLGETK